MSDFKRPAPTLSDALKLTEDQFHVLAETVRDSIVSSSLKTDALLKAGARVKLDQFFSEEPLSEYEKKLLLVGLLIGEALVRAEMVTKTLSQMFGGLDND